MNKIPKMDVRKMQDIFGALISVPLIRRKTIHSCINKILRMDVRKMQDVFGMLISLLRERERVKRFLRLLRPDLAAENMTS